MEYFLGVQEQLSIRLTGQVIFPLPLKSPCHKMPNEQELETFERLVCFCMLCCQLPSAPTKQNTEKYFVKSREKKGIWISFPQ